MIQRIDIIMDNNEYKMVHGDINLSQWVVAIKNESIVATCLSNANKSRERAFVFPVQEGSLFLYNSSYDFYAFFRSAKNQEILDRMSIIKIHSVKDNTIQILTKSMNGVETDPIVKLHNVYLDNGSTRIKVIKDRDNELKLITRIYKTVDPSIPSFVIQKGKDDKSNILYLDRNFNVKDIDEFIP